MTFPWTQTRDEENDILDIEDDADETEQDEGLTADAAARIAMYTYEEEA